MVYSSGNFRDIPYDELRGERRFKYSSTEAFLDVVFYKHLFVAGSISFIVKKNISSLTQCYILRTWDDMREVLLDLKANLFLNENHRLRIHTEDLSVFLHYAIKKLEFDESIIAKSKDQILLVSMFSGAIEFDSLIPLAEMNVSDLALFRAGEIIENPFISSEISSKCTLKENELSFFLARSRMVLDFYCSEIENTLTLTSKIKREIEKEKSKLVQKKSKINIDSMIRNQSPLKDESTKKTLLPLLVSAFFGGHNFIDDYERGRTFEDVINIDFSAAYSFQILFKKYPIKKFKNIAPPMHWNDIFHSPKFKNKPLLVTFKATGVSLKNKQAGNAFLPIAPRHAWDTYINEGINEYEKRNHECDKILSAKVLTRTLTDIDFKLFTELYKFEKIEILNIQSSEYGFLPSYISNILIRYIQNKNFAKAMKDDINEFFYKHTKTKPARFYGIFSMSPIRQCYKIDRNEKKIRFQNESEGGKYQIYDSMKYSGVLYQWGVWVTSYARYDLLKLKEKIDKNGGCCLSGDTDCLNCLSDPNTLSIITDFNKNVKKYKKYIASKTGYDLEMIGNIGELNIKKYQLFKMTGVKQYAYIENGTFHFKASGLNKTCTYFSQFNSEIEKFDHFVLGLKIPAEFKARELRSYRDSTKRINYIDREGNEISEKIESYVETVSLPFTISPAIDDSLWTTKETKQILKSGRLLDAIEKDSGYKEIIFKSKKDNNK